MQQHNAARPRHLPPAPSLRFSLHIKRFIPARVLSASSRMHARKQQVLDGVASPSLCSAAATASSSQLISQFPHPKKRSLPSASPRVPHDLDYLRSAIRVIPDFPKPGVSFKDITPLLRDPVAYNMLIQLMKERVQSIGGGVHSMFVFCLKKQFEF
jgi:hypothetical protein